MIGPALAVSAGMGKRAVFVLLLGGCFPDVSCPPCADYYQSGVSCDATEEACFYSACHCGPQRVVVCPNEDLSVPRDLAPPPRDLTQPDDGGDAD